MTLRYVRSGAGGSANGTSWANAYLTLGAAMTAAAAGDAIFVSEDHAESSSSTQTFTSPGTTASPVLVTCVNHSGSVPPVSADLRTTATVSTTGSGVINFAGDAIAYEGITFTSGDTSTNATMTLQGTTLNQSVKFKNCALRLGNTNTNSRITIIGSSGGGGSVEWENTTVQFANASQSISLFGELIWKNTPSALTGATLPTTLFTFSSNRGNSVDMRGVDVSALGSGKTIFGASSSGIVALQASMVDCKIDAAVTLCATPNGRGSGGLDYTRVDSGGTNYKHGRIRYAGTQTEETTIVRTGGASDGTTTISWKIVTTANCNQYMPYESLPIAIWNDTVGSAVTATVQGIWGGGAVPNNDDIWGEVEYLGSSGSPLASFVNNGKADSLASNAGLSAGSGTWGGSTTKFQLAVTFTPQQKGWLFFRVKAAKASSTFYIDPKIVLT
jgi:hypothetical protein